MTHMIYYNPDQREYFYEPGYGPRVPNRCEWIDDAGTRCTDDIGEGCEHYRCLVHEIQGWEEALAEAIAENDTRAQQDCVQALIRLGKVWE